MNQTDHLDITVDLESLSLSTNAAILQIAAVAWNRKAASNPFFADMLPFVGHVDIRSCVKDRFDICPNTVKWWGDQADAVKDSVLTPPAYPLKDVLESLAEWMQDAQKSTGAKTALLWAQGSDFDIANLRNAFARYQMPFPVSHHCFRDARTFILEMGCFVFETQDMEDVYKKLLPLPGDEMTHDAVHDAKRTSWNVWQLMGCVCRKSGMEPITPPYDI